MRRVVVFGAGRSGLAAANFLAKRGLDVVLTDVRSSSELGLEGRVDARVRRAFGGHPEDLLDGVDTVVLSPGISRDVPILRRAVRRGIPLISEIELASRFLRGKVIAVTGTNGKSTTTSLIGEILREDGLDPVVAGNIGVALTDEIREEEAIYVLELSSFQLETVDTFHADIALLLNITPDHLDRYASIDEYAEAKYRIFRNQTARDFAIVNAMDPRTAHPDIPARVWRFSTERPVVPGAWLEGSQLVLDTGSGLKRIGREQLAIAGAANVENALAAWLAARAAGASDEAVLRAFQRFHGLPHRMSRVRELDGVTWINDSKGTNVDATLKSLEGMPDDSVILILGGKEKGDDFARLREMVRSRARVVLTIGAASRAIAAAINDVVDVRPVETLERAVELARELAQPGQLVLLSPACASFDQYANYEERGEHFEHLVRALEVRS